MNIIGTYEELEHIFLETGVSSNVSENIRNNYILINIPIHLYNTPYELRYDFLPTSLKYQSELVKQAVDINGENYYQNHIEEFV